MYQNAKQAETKCKKVGSYNWTNMLAAAGQAVQFAIKELNSLVHGNAPYLPTDNRDSAIMRAKSNHDNAYAVLNEICNHAADIHESKLELKATTAAAEQNTTKEKILKAMLKREHEKDIYSLLRYTVGGKVFQALDELWIPDNPQDFDNTTWTAIVEAQAIWEMLISQGKEHFSQASDTPFVSGPVNDLIGPFKFNNYSNQILNGTCNIDSITDTIKLHEIIKAMAHPDPSNPITSDYFLTLDGLKEGFSYIKESTSSAPDGLHHGHWKTLICNDDAFEPYGLMIMFAFCWGEPPATWENALQIILGKDELGKPIQSTHTRCIQLVCAGMNMGFHQIWGHAMLKQATTNGLISDFQFGARSGHMSLSAVLINHASYDIVRLMRTIAVIFDNDAMACYDRMIPSQCMILSV